MLRKLVPVCLLGFLFLAPACGDDDDDDPGGDAGEAGEAGTSGTSGTGGSAPEAGTGGTGDEAGAGGSGEPDVERGRYLVDHVIACPDCHTPRDTMGAPILAEYMSGAECFAQLPSGDCLHTPNLTNDPTGLANRTDDEIETMIRDGIRPSATGDEALHPAMPYYVFHNMADADLDAIVAYLRTIPAVEHEVPRSDPAFEVPAPVNPIDVTTIPMPADDYPELESALRGRYLATQIGLCIECHTPHNMAADVLDPSEYFMGGEEFPIGLPVTPISKNLTSDPETGIGEWTVEDIVNVLKQGADRDGDGICPPMPAGPMAAYGGLTDGDATDIANYLLSLPPIVNEVVDMCTFP